MSDMASAFARASAARDGRLLDLALARSSGYPDLDRGVMETVRQASPFVPLPPDIAADRYTLIVPITYVHER
jgi:protein TonB